MLCLAHAYDKGGTLCLKALQGGAAVCLIARPSQVRILPASPDASLPHFGGGSGPCGAQFLGIQKQCSQTNVDRSRRRAPLSRFPRGPLSRLHCRAASVKHATSLHQVQAETRSGTPARRTWSVCLNQTSPTRSPLLSTLAAMPCWLKCCRKMDDLLTHAALGVLDRS